MKIKVSKHKLNIHYRGSPRGGRTQQHAYCLRYAHSQHTESHLGKKQRQAKIPIAFLFSQLHFNNVTSYALFYGGHLVMRSAKPGNHLKTGYIGMCSAKGYVFFSLFVLPIGYQFRLFWSEIGYCLCSSLELGKVFRRISYFFDSSLGEETISLLMFTQLPDCVKPFKVTLKFSFKAQ